MDLIVLLLSLIFFSVLYIHNDLTQFTIFRDDYIYNYYRIISYISFNFINVILTSLYFSELIYFNTINLFLMIFSYKLIKLIYCINKLPINSMPIYNIFSFILCSILVFTTKVHIINIISSLFIIFIDFDFIRIKLD